MKLPQFVNTSSDYWITKSFQIVFCFVVKVKSDIVVLASTTTGCLLLRWVLTELCPHNVWPNSTLSFDTSYCHNIWLSREICSTKYAVHNWMVAVKQLVTNYQWQGITSAIRYVWLVVISVCNGSRGGWYQTIFFSI